MAALGPVEQTLHVFETIDAHFKANPGLLNTDGIFRISSAGRKHIDLAEAIERNSKIDWAQYSAHDCANALKYVLLQKRLLAAQDERVQAFMEMIKDDKTNDKVFLEFINSLYKSEDDKNIAKIANIALDICRRTAIQENHNRMSPKNLAVVWGPAFQHCFNMEPKGDDFTAQVFFTMNQLNPALEKCISQGLPEVVPSLLTMKRRMVDDAAREYQGSQRMLNIADEKMARLRQQQIELQKALDVKIAILKKGGLTRKEKKDLKNVTIPKLQLDLKALEHQIENWKLEAKRYLHCVTNYGTHTKLLSDSVDRLEVMLSEMTPSGSDEENSIGLDTDELLNASPILIVQYAQQDKEDQQELLEHAPTTAERARAATL